MRARRPTICPRSPPSSPRTNAPEEIAEIAKRLRESAGLPKEPTGTVASRPKAGRAAKPARKRAAKKA